MCLVRDAVKGPTRVARDPYDHVEVSTTPYGASPVPGAGADAPHRGGISGGQIPRSPARPPGTMTWSSRRGGVAMYEGMRSSRRGYSLVELQVAITVMAIVFLILGGHARVQRQLLSSATADRKVDGYFDIAAERGFFTYSVTATEPATPPCDITVLRHEKNQGVDRVTVRVEQILP